MCTKTSHLDFQINKDISSHGSSNVFFRASRYLVSKYMHLVRNFFVSVTNFNFKSVVKMQDTGHFTGESDRPRPEVVRLFWHKKVLPF